MHIFVHTVNAQILLTWGLIWSGAFKGVTLKRSQMQMLRSCFDSPPYQAISCRAGFLWAAAPSPNWLCPLHCTTPVCSPWSRNRCRIGLINHSWSALAWRAIWVLQAYGVIPWGNKTQGRKICCSTCSGWNLSLKLEIALLVSSSTHLDWFHPSPGLLVPTTHL